MRIESGIGNISMEGGFGTDWKVCTETEVLEKGLEIIRIKWTSEKELPPPATTFSVSLPLHDVHSRWVPEVFTVNRNMPMDWFKKVSSDMASASPIMSFMNIRGENRLTLAFSDAWRPVSIAGGVHEDTAELNCKVTVFSDMEAPMTSYEAELRLDIRNIFYADAIRSTTEYFSSFPEYTPASVPETAWEPLYSTWYSYKQYVTGGEMENECRLAKDYGIKSIIVDDGWQTDTADTMYLSCGDWDAAKSKFPRMAEHVKKIHEYGLKYMLWYALPFIGYGSKAYETFKGKYLFRNDWLKTAVVDPRFPDVREFLIQVCEKALREWDIDGFKLDFIENFQSPGGNDPAIGQNYAGRDTKYMPEACDRLFTELRARLEAIKPGLLIEFRQPYMGPALRKYGNILRAADCPMDILANRMRTLDLRLTSGSTAVHSDMLQWHRDAAPETAALQFLNVIFSVPQISMKMEKLSESHRKMLHFWLDFWRNHKETLLHGYLKPYHPELNYPMVTAETEKEIITVIYSGSQVTEISGTGRTCYVINASGFPELYLDIQNEPLSCECFDVLGNSCGKPELRQGVMKVQIPCSGLLKIQYR